LRILKSWLMSKSGQTRPQWGGNGRGKGLLRHAGGDQRACRTQRHWGKSME